MEQVFIYVLNNAITVSALIAAIIVVRALGKKMPKWSICMLWVIVAVKLLFPIKLESVFSLIPTREPIREYTFMEKSRQMNSGISNVVGIANPVQNHVAVVNPMRILLDIGAVVWLVGMIVMLLYAVATYILVRRRVSASVRVRPWVYMCDDISDSFIFGIIFPRIYVPSGLSKEARRNILKHEFAHLRRYDYLWKPIGFVLLSVYWFNPLCWIAYVLLCKDIEYACDEEVIKNIGKNKKAEYCRILLEHSMPKKMIAACPVAFGETDVKNRIRNVANYKKPVFWIKILSFLVCIAVGLCFATNRYSELVTIKSGKLEDSQFMYNGTVISLDDSFEKIDKALGGYEHYSEGCYEYCKKDFGLYVYEQDGATIPFAISTGNDMVITSRNIKVGSTRDEVISAYGNPNNIHDFDDRAEFLDYYMGDYKVEFLIEFGKVMSIDYVNDYYFDAWLWG